MDNQQNKKNKILVSQRKEGGSHQSQTHPLFIYTPDETKFQQTGQIMNKELFIRLHFREIHLKRGSQHLSIRISKLHSQFML